MRGPVGAGFEAWREFVRQQERLEPARKVLTLERLLHPDFGEASELEKHEAKIADIRYTVLISDDTCCCYLWYRWHVFDSQPSPFSPDFSSLPSFCLYYCIRRRLAFPPLPYAGFPGLPEFPFAVWTCRPVPSLMPWCRPLPRTLFIPCTLLLLCTILIPCTPLIPCIPPLYSVPSLYPVLL